MTVCSVQVIKYLLLRRVWVWFHNPWTTDITAIPDLTRRSLCSCFSHSCPFCISQPCWPHQILANLIGRPCRFVVTNKIITVKTLDPLKIKHSVACQEFHNFPNQSLSLSPYTPCMFGKEMCLPSYQLPHPQPPSLKRKLPSCKALSDVIFRE